nr:increased rdna silencing protein 4 [Quercus suber]
MSGSQSSRAPSRVSSSNSLRAGVGSGSGGPGFGGVAATSAQLEAFIGASRAFGRPQPAATSPSSSGPATYGALAATTAARSKTPSPRSADDARSKVSPVGNRVLPSSQGQVGTATRDVPVLDHKVTPSLKPSKRRDVQAAPTTSSGGSSVHTHSATIPDPRTDHKPAVAPKPQPLSVQSIRDHEQSSDRSADTSPIAPTTSLVALFERTSSNSATPEKRPDPIVIKPSLDLPMRSPKPVRTSDGGITQLFKMQLEDTRRSPEGVMKGIEVADSATKSHIDAQSPTSDDAYTSAPENPATSRPPISLPKRVGRTGNRSPPVSATSPSSIAGRLQIPPTPMGGSQTGPRNIQYSRTTVSPPGQLLSVSAQSGKSIPAQYNHLYPRRLTPLNTGDDLANAIVASSLASARAPSPRKVEPPPPPSRRSKGHKLSFSRTPSPAKHAMLSTLRKIESSESEDEEENHPYGKHKKKRLVRKHPNKHHEGDRKRWRDAVTERERKRYEGVWAANKGLHISFTPEEEARFRRTPNSDATLTDKVAINECVSSLVTRDIWTRSRLPESTLETVWDLVDHECIGRLSKAEFVVGLWLIDQGLKGRKLPVRVTDSVWASVRTLQGIKIKK